MMWWPVPSGGDPGCQIQPIKITDLIRRQGREPGGGYPKGWVEAWVYRKGKRRAWHGWIPYAAVLFTPGPPTIGGSK